MAAKHGGGKLKKTEVVQVRLDPMLRMAAELAANTERRTLSAFIEMAVDRAVKQCVVTTVGENLPVTAWKVAQECWSAEPAWRLNALYGMHPELLTIREKTIMGGIAFLGKMMAFGQKYTDPDLVEIALAGYGWDELCQYADGEISFDDLFDRLQSRLEMYRKKIEAAPNPS